MDSSESSISDHIYHRHFAIHKPCGYLSQFVNNQKRKSKNKLLGELYPFPENTMAIGRLDTDSEGLLLLTTDGKVSEWVRHKNIDKEYYVQLDGLIHDEALNQLRSGIEISVQKEKYLTLPSKVERLEKVPNFPPRSKRIRDERHGPSSWISITINEGKFRQVRKMTAACGFPTLRLIRVRIGDIHLANMEPGDVREINKLDI